MSKRIIILGAGPTGLGAAYRLTELGYKNWAIYEKEDHIGGLASSFKDSMGFTWDVGGHVLFSHYTYFDELFEKLIKNQYIEHKRESWIWLLDRWVPYPFQNNIRYLPKERILECVLGILKAQAQKTKSQNFKEWILSTFGKGIADCFLLPYNRKLWKCPLEFMSKDWIEERISVVDTEKVLKNLILEEDDKNWGPNSRFKFPLHGGTGGFFSLFELSIREHLWTKKEVVSVDPDKRELKFADNQTVPYDILISTIPLDQSVKFLNPHQEDLLRSGSELEYCGVLVVGIGFNGFSADSKCWVYFPEENVPFYRVTYFSRYSPFNVPDSQYSSFMCEISYSASNLPDAESIIEETIRGLIHARIISEKDQDKIVSRYLIQRDHAYPIPSLSRDPALKTIQTYLMQKDIYSRGRFGAWKYEIGNMDHSVMMGVEVVDKILNDREEKTWKM